MLCSMSQGWKVEHDDSGQLVATHQHDIGDPHGAEIKRGEDGYRYAECGCGAVFTIGRDRGPEAAEITRPSE